MSASVPDPRREDPTPADPGRRSFLSRLSFAAMLGGLASGYGTLAAIAARFLYPAGKAAADWLYVVDVAGMAPGSSLAYLPPGGAPVSIARTGSAGVAEDFIALSSTCPHLGCRVHWEGANRRFYCPCHNGTFDPSGRATGGPPAEAGQSLPRYPLKIEKGGLFIHVPLERLVSCRRHGGPGGCRGGDPGDGTAIA